MQPSGSGAATRSRDCAGGKLAATNECGELSAASWPRRTGPLALRAALRAGPRTAPASSITSQQPRGKPVASDRPERTTQQRNAVATEKKKARGDTKQAMPRTRRCHARGDANQQAIAPPAPAWPAGSVCLFTLLRLNYDMACHNSGGVRSTDRHDPRPSQPYAPPPPPVKVVSTDGQTDRHTAKGG